MAGVTHQEKVVDGPPTLNKNNQNMSDKVYSQRGKWFGSCFDSMGGLGEGGVIEDGGEETTRRMSYAKDNDKYDP